MKIEIYTNNALGNITGIGSNTYVWDYKNRLISSVVNSNTDYYTYDQNNIRVEKGNGIATTTYPNMYYNTDGTTVTKHIFDPLTNTLLATIEGNGTATSTNYIHTDHLGGTNVVTDESGEVKEVADYYPFGEQRINTGTFTEQRKFTGHEFDEENDLTYAKQRYYDQDVGRWLSQDPAFLFVGTQKLADIMKVGDENGGDENERVRKAVEQYLLNPQQLNSYSYANNNPVNLKDPQGEFVIGPIAGIIIKTAFEIASLGLTVSALDEVKTTIFDYPDQFTSQEKTSSGIKALMFPGFKVFGGVFGTVNEKVSLDILSNIMDVTEITQKTPEAINKMYTNLRGLTGDNAPSTKTNTVIKENN